MSEGGRPNSQPQRTSSNIEVRIPQATPSSNNLPENETNQTPSDQPDTSQKSEVSDEGVENLEAKVEPEKDDDQENVQPTNTKETEMVADEQTGQIPPVKITPNENESHEKQVERTSTTEDQPALPKEQDISQNSATLEQQYGSEEVTLAAQEDTKEGTISTAQPQDNDTKSAPDQQQDQDKIPSPQPSQEREGSQQDQSEVKQPEDPAPQSQPGIKTPPSSPKSPKDTTRPQEQAAIPENAQPEAETEIIRSLDRSSEDTEKPQDETADILSKSQKTHQEQNATQGANDDICRKDGEGMDKSNVEDDQRAPSHASQKESKRSSAASSRNLEAMQAALDTRKESGTGFVLSSQFEAGGAESAEDRPTQREQPERSEETTETRPKMATTSVRFQTGKSFHDQAYVTEVPDRDFIMDGRESRESHAYSPAYIDTGGRRSSEAGQQEKPKKKKRDSKRTQLLARLDLAKPPKKYILSLRPLKKDPDPDNKAPLNPNIYYAELPKHGGQVKTPFYMQVDIPEEALEGNVRLKFERQEFDRMELALTEDDTLCSCIVDLNMEPPSHRLRRVVTLRMRILDKCINKYEDTVIITTRHFTWTRVPTKIESKSVNGEKHFYAVTRTQTFGKFAVINTPKMDRFIITKAGGDFHSTIQPEIKLHVNEYQLNHHSPQMVELIVRKTRDEAVKQINQEIPSIQGVEGRLVAASPMIEISKDVMTQSGKMKDGIRFPEQIVLRIPVPQPVVSHNEDGLAVSGKIIIAQKHTNPHYNTINGHRYFPNAYSSNDAHLWEDVTKASRMAVNSVSFVPNEMIEVKVSAPGKYMVLVFDEDGIQPEDVVEEDLDDLSNEIVEKNENYKMNVMVHQKISQPSIIFIHMVTSDAVKLISKTMRKTNEWKRVYVSEVTVMHEWQPIKLEFKGDLQLTVNQTAPRLRFHSKRWQGYQIQLEATQEAFKSEAEKFTGSLQFLQEGHRAMRKTKSTISVESDDGHKVLSTVDVEIDRDRAKPHEQTVVVTTLPKVPIFREYKLKWLNNLSEEEIYRYKATHGI